MHSRMLVFFDGFVCVKPLYIFWMIFILDLALSYTDKLLVLRWVLLCASCSWCVFILLSSLFCISVKQAEIIEAFKSTSRYLDDLLNVDSPYFKRMVNRIYPPELQLNKANTADAEAPYLNLHLSISNGFASSKIYDKRDDFDFDIVKFPFLDGDVPRSTSYGVLISQKKKIRFARVSSHVADFNARNKSLMPNFSNRTIGIINFEILSSNFIVGTTNWFLNSMLD